jgi:hypothetical protein
MQYNYTFEYSLLVIEKLKDFSDYLKDNCIYKDTWIWSEELIAQNYYNYVDDLLVQVDDEIKRNLELGVFWVIQEKTEEYELTKLVIFPRKYYKIVLICKKFLKEKTFIIEDIIIGR